MHDARSRFHSTVARSMSTSVLALPRSCARSLSPSPLVSGLCPLFEPVSSCACSQPALCPPLCPTSLYTGRPFPYVYPTRLACKVLWCLGATAHEIATLGVAENVEQHQRRKHCELDNILQISSWVSGMTAATRGKLDSTKNVDVYKYAVILGNAMQPTHVDPWLRNLLRGDPPTFDNRLKAITTEGVTQKFLNDKKAAIAHPQITNFKQLSSRIRAVRGIKEWSFLHTAVHEEVLPLGGGGLFLHNSVLTSKQSMQSAGWL